MHINDIPLVDSEQRAPLSLGSPHIKGVYFLTSKDEIVYIGMASNVFNRVASHAGAYKASEFDGFYYIPVSDPKERKNLESELIEKVKPRLNGRKNPGVYKGASHAEKERRDLSPDAVAHALLNRPYEKRESYRPTRDISKADVQRIICSQRYYLSARQQSGIFHVCWTYKRVKRAMSLKTRNVDVATALFNQAMNRMEEVHTIAGMTWDTEDAQP